MKSRKFFTLLALMVGFITLASCKGQAKNNEAQATPKLQEKRQQLLYTSIRLTF